MDQEVDSIQERLSRQTVLAEFGEKGRDAICNAHFLVIGAGGLGSPAILYLAGAGAGKITVIDNDTVSVTNLSRQLLHTTDRVGVNKAESAKQTIAQHTPFTEIVAIDELATEDRLFELMQDADVVLDCADNLATRVAAGRAAKRAKKPLVFGSAIRFNGQVTVFDGRDLEAPNFDDLFEPDDGANDVKAARVGVFSGLTGVVGTLQACEALKCAANVGEPLIGRLLMIDTLNMTFDTIRYKKKKH